MSRHLSAGGFIFWGDPPDALDGLFAYRGSLWINAADVSATQCVFDTRNAAGNSGVAVKIGASKVTLVVSTYTGKSNQSASLSSAATLTAYDYSWGSGDGDFPTRVQGWTHIAFDVEHTDNGGANHWINRNLWVNGVKVSGSTDTRDPWAATGQSTDMSSLLFVGMNNAAGEPYAGEVSHLMLGSGLWTDEEIEQLYAETGEGVGYGFDPKDVAGSGGTLFHAPLRDDLKDTVSDVAGTTAGTVVEYIGPPCREATAAKGVWMLGDTQKLALAGNTATYELLGNLLQAYYAAGCFDLVAHVGDIVDDAGGAGQRNRGNNFIEALAEVPFLAAAGNHDYNDSGTMSEGRRLDEFFQTFNPLAFRRENGSLQLVDARRTLAAGEFGTANDDDHFITIWLATFGARQWVVATTGYLPDTEQLDWIVDRTEHYDLPLFLLTHYWLATGDASITSAALSSEANPISPSSWWTNVGQYLHNLVLVACGHQWNSSSQIGWSGSHALSAHDGHDVVGVRIDAQDEQNAGGTYGGGEGSIFEVVSADGISWTGKTFALITGQRITDDAADQSFTLTMESEYPPPATEEFAGQDVVLNPSLPIHLGVSTPTRACVSITVDAGETNAALIHCESLHDEGEYAMVEPGETIKFRASAGLGQVSALSASGDTTIDYAIRSDR